MEFLYKRRFLEGFDRLSAQDQKRVIEAERGVRAFCESRRAAPGLGIKSLHSGRSKVWEARAGVRLRLLWVETESLVSFVFIGSHDEVRRFLRSLA